MAEHYSTTMDRSRQWLKENTKRYAFKKLQRDIINKGICVECGSCVASCPVDALTGDTSSGKYVPTLTGECDACGICYAMCPRTFSLWRDVAGEFRSVWRVRSLGEHKRQDGGAVTAILTHLLNTGTVDGAIVAGQDPNDTWRPVAKLVSDSSELDKHAGTIYGHAPVVGAMMNAYKEGHHSLAVVGTACDIDAINKLEEHPAGFFSLDSHSSVFKIGLFCMESFEYDKLKDWLKEKGISMKDITRFAISGGEFRVVTGEGETGWPVAELNPAVSSSCPYCQDLTAVNADISCGNIGSDEGYTTVIVRTTKAEQILQEIMAKGLVEAEMLDAKALRKIQNVARSKRYSIYRLKHD
ncbi:MAG: hypothetical protein DRO87_10860 [Candidatus Thorarchaeota archaeon]|nr:MAG: hypothetical protein DRO87_10860 [Candidatus Thorarchaeota archaeon]RLI58161.1 MAG: hypothetical protein DRP09_00015 [Candidatus Thorarchaeota archaeon]